MSRIGKKTIPIPANVKINLSPGCIELTGPQGSIKQRFPKQMSVKIDEAQKIIQVSRPDEEKESKAFHGLTRSLIANAVDGVTKGFRKTLEISGTGYNAKLKGKHLELQIGFCLPVTMMIPDGITAELPNPVRIILKGCDKQLVGQFAAEIRAIHVPDHYKGKGIKYEGEVLKIKAGKTFAGAGAS